MKTDLTSNCMMLRQTPQMLKKSGIKKWRRNELPGINRQNRLCWKTECWKATWRNWRERIGACTHCGQLNEYPALPTPLLPTPLSPIISFHIQADTSLFLSILVLKINFTYFSHNYDNYSMFRDVLSTAPWVSHHWFPLYSRDHSELDISLKDDCGAHSKMEIR